MNIYRRFIWFISTCIGVVCLFLAFLVTWWNDTSTRNGIERKMQAEDFRVIVLFEEDQKRNLDILNAKLVLDEERPITIKQAGSELQLVKVLSSNHAGPKPVYVSRIPGIPGITAVYAAYKGRAAAQNVRQWLKENGYTHHDFSTGLVPFERNHQHETENVYPVNGESCINISAYFETNDAMYLWNGLSVQELGPDREGGMTAQKNRREAMRDIEALIQGFEKIAE